MSSACLRRPGQVQLTLPLTKFMSSACLRQPVYVQRKRSDRCEMSGTVRPPSPGLPSREMV
jgi:hypothetical protein